MLHPPVSMPARRGCTCVSMAGVVVAAVHALQPLVQ
jgi:hypothetical protein